MITYTIFIKKLNMMTDIKDDEQIKDDDRY